ncbi:MAG: hypothetical protein M1839_005795 [Geoglossum umbratile]|nr:MAG: hypothetical protein M1839_005795 [Geoglossum umbratile]
METIALLILFASLPRVNADGWDDFTNNLATDLAPLLALFGEQVTKQFLSESLSLWDNFIFAMAPLGILTAVVSVIRVLGNSSLKAFVGRAQEPPGNAELELLSSTSETTAELWNDGGIARVFGSPKILEVISNPNLIDGEDYYKKDAGSAPPPIGLYPFDEAVSNGIWVETGKQPSNKTRGPSSPRDLEPGNQEDTRTPNPVRNPNLSFNVGIQQRHKGYTIGAAIIGFLLQGGVLIFSGLAKYYFPSSRFEKNGKPMSSWAFPLAFSGTCLLCLGMFTCAFLIERCTLEAYYEKPRSNLEAKVYWIQPGGQKVGDQVFDACVLIGDRTTYISSSKTDNSDQNVSEVKLLAAVGITMLGFVLQFVGLRGMHSSVAMAQLGATGIMAIIRSGLRTKRTKREQNLLKGVKMKVHGHELDWFAMKLEDATNWEVAKPSATSGNPSTGTRYVGFLETGESADETNPNFGEKGSEVKRISSLQADNAHLTRDISIPRPNRAARIMKSRARLAQIIESRDGALWHTITGARAVSIKKTIEEVMNVLFASGTTLKDGWDKASKFYWTIDCRCTNTPLPVPVCLSLRRTDMSLNSPSASWVVDALGIEAVLGLWVWSIIKEMPDRSDPKYNRIVATVEESEVEAARMEYKLWTQRSSDCKTVPNSLISADSWFFGWPMFDEKHATIMYVPRDLSPASASSTKDDNVSIMCAQDIFITFFAAVTGIIENMGGTTKPREDNPTMEIALEDSALDETWDGGFHLLNSQLDKITEVFVKNGLGSREDAYMCVIPALSKASKLPSLESAYESAEVATRALQEKGQFSKAAGLLKWVRDSRSKNAQSGNPAARSAYAAAETKVGELYRTVMYKAINALRHSLKRPPPDDKIDSYKSDYEFGLEGIVEMLSAPNGPTETSKRYGWIALQIAQENEDIHKKVGVVQHLRGLRGTVRGYNETNKHDLLYWVKEYCGKRDESQECQVIYRLDAITVVRLILGRDEVNVDIQDPNSGDIIPENNGRTSLSWAAQSGELDLMRLLLDQQNVEPNIANTNQKTPLSYAAEEGHDEIIRLLMERDISYINEKDSTGRTSLMLAAKNGHKAVVHVLLDKTIVRLDVRDQSGSTALALATDNGHEAVAKLLVEKGSDIEAKDSNGQTPLSRAARRGEGAVAKLLVENGADIDAKDNDGQTPLFWAVKNGHEGVVELLVKDRANIEAKDSDSRTPLSWAAAVGHEAVIKLLVEKGANIEAKDINSQTPLWRAARRGQETAVKLLVENGADVEARDSKNQTPLLWAALGGHETAVKPLVENRADIEAADSKGQTPLWWAARGGHEAAAKLLIEKGANLEVKGSDGRTPLWWAAYNGHEAVMKLLVAKGANVEADDGRHTTPLQCAAEKGHEAIARLLIEKGADIEIMDRKGLTPLWWAARGGHEAVIQLLVEKGANVELKDSNGQTPLWWAARRGQERAAKLLVEKGANVEAKDTNDQTPLSWAAQGGHEAVAKLLTEHGADIEAKDNNGLTPLWWAKSEGHDEVVKLLESAPPP